MHENEQDYLMSSPALVTLTATFILYSADQQGNSSMGSGFFVKVSGSENAKASNIVAVTALHNISDALRRKESVQIQSTGLIGRPHKALTRIPASSWRTHPNHDVALSFLELNQAEMELQVEAIPSAWLNEEIRWTHPLPTIFSGAVTIGENPIVISRSGTMPTEVYPRVSLANFGMVKVALSEGSATHGMSGGPVIVNADGQTALLGLVHGYSAPPVPVDQPPRGEAETFWSVREKLHRAKADIAALRHNLVFIVPREEILFLLNLS